MEVSVTKFTEIHEGTVKYNLQLAADGAPSEKFKVDYAEGEPGIGKTSAIRQAALNVANDKAFMAEIGKGLDCDASTLPVRTVIAAQYEATDIGGLPWHNGEGMMIRLRPEMLPGAGIGVLFFDEMSKAKQSVMNVLGQLTLERRVGEHQIAPGWSIVGAGNRRQDRSGDQEIPRFLLDRLAVYDLVSSKADWLDYAMEHLVDPAVIWFVKSNDEWFQKFDPQSKINPTARSWEKISDYIKSGNWTGQNLRATVESTVGGPGGHAFYSFYSLREKLPDPESVLADPKNAPIPADHQARYALMAALSGSVSRKTISGFNEYLKRFDVEVENGRETAVFSVQMVRAKDKTVFMTDAGMDIMERYAEDVLG